jgi:hypothetical protein
MGYGKPSIRLAGAVVLASVAGLASLAGTAHATYACPTYPTAEPFTPWADAGDYFLGPSGSFEGSLTGWTAKGKPVIVSGNESFHVNSPSDTHSLSLPNGTALTSPSICVTLDTPDFRMFVMNTGTATSILNVNMTYTDNKGKTHMVTVAKLSRLTVRGAVEPCHPGRGIRHPSYEGLRMTPIETVQPGLQSGSHPTDIALVTPETGVPTTPRPA